MLGFGILAAGAVLLWAALTGKADHVLSALNADVSKFDATVPNTPIGGNASSGGGGGTKQITVNLPGGGAVTVNANSPAAAVENVRVETGQTGTVREG